MWLCKWVRGAEHVCRMGLIWAEFQVGTRVIRVDLFLDGWIWSQHFRLNVVTELN